MHATMAKYQQNLHSLRLIFNKSVEAVRPSNLLTPANRYNLRPETRDGGRHTIQIQGKTIDITRKHCHVVGFGKAVLGMAVQLEAALSDHLVGGLISIPIGTVQQFCDVPEMQLRQDSHIEVVEGGRNNQPDEAALGAAQRIKALASRMTENDILFVLISGGGSALLPLPRPPLTLLEKMELIRQLANRGATIEEMNFVRIAFSDIKGGRLAVAAHNAYAIISFVISDIVNDPVYLIASGPTCAPVLKSKTAREVLRKYDMWAQLPQHMRHMVETPLVESEVKPGANNSIYVVGDNRVATAAALQEALQCHFNPFIASTVVQGEVPALVQRYKELLCSIYEFRKRNIDVKQLEKRFPFDSRIFQHFVKTLTLCEKNGKPLLLILAGEPTVKVTGNGLGGRNQELALRMSLELYENPDFHEISFLSAGTDGIDGPTPAAGAIGGHAVIADYLKDTSKSLDDVRKCLQDNNSYHFYQSLNAGEYHVNTGHTGTNVMDLQFLLIP